MSSRFYRKSIPDIDDIVMVRVLDTNENGFSVSLLEYEGMTGLLPDTEIFKKRTKKKRLVKKGDELPLVVMYSDDKTKLVQLSKKRVKDDDIEPFLEHYRYSSSLNKLGLEVFRTYLKYCHKKGLYELNEDNIMERTIWKIIDESIDDEYLQPSSKGGEVLPDYEGEHKPEDIYNSILLNPHLLLENSDLPDDFISFFLSNMANRISKEDQVLEAEINLLVIGIDGVEGLKDILDLSKLEIPETHKASVSMISPPLYLIRVECPPDSNGLEVINNIISKLKNKSGEYKSKFIVNKEPTITKHSKADIKFLSEYDIDNIDFD